MEIVLTELDKIVANTKTSILVEKFIQADPIKYATDIEALNVLLLQVSQLKRAKLYYGRKIDSQSKEIIQLREENRLFKEQIENYKQGL